MVWRHSARRGPFQAHQQCGAWRSWAGHFHSFVRRRRDQEEKQEKVERLKNKQRKNDTPLGYIYPIFSFVLSLTVPCFNSFDFFCIVPLHNRFTTLTWLFSVVLEPPCFLCLLIYGLDYWALSWLCFPPIERSKVRIHDIIDRRLYTRMNLHCKESLKSFLCSWVTVIPNVIMHRWLIFRLSMLKLLLLDISCIGVRADTNVNPPSSCFLSCRPLRCFFFVCVCLPFHWIRRRFETPPRLTLFLISLDGQSSSVPSTVKESVHSPSCC